MRFQEIAILFSATVLAAQLNERQADAGSALMRRQQFTPVTTTAEGATCADAFGAGYQTCTFDQHPTPTAPWLYNVAVWRFISQSN
jgi:hypothetical protein